MNTFILISAVLLVCYTGCAHAQMGGWPMMYDMDYDPWMGMGMGRMNRWGNMGWGGMSFPMGMGGMAMGGMPMGGMTGMTGMGVLGGGDGIGGGMDTMDNSAQQGLMMRNMMGK